MTDAPKTTDAAPKKKRASFVRTEKPTFAIITITDENGQPMRVTKDRISIQLEKDSARIVDLVTSGDMGTATVVRVSLPVAPKRAAPAAT